MNGNLYPQTTFCQRMMTATHAVQFKAMQTQLPNDLFAIHARLYLERYIME